MNLKGWNKLNNKGFTLIEVLITTFIGVGMLITIFFIPVEMTQMHFFVSDNIELVQDSNIVSSYIYSDISKGVESIADLTVDKCVSIDNMVNTELRYCFSDNGIIRREDGEEKRISELRTDYHLNGEILWIYIHYDDSRPPYELKYLLNYPLLEREGAL